MDSSNDIFSFAQEYLLYFRLQEKLNFHFDGQNRSGIFLRAIQFSEFADTVIMLQTQMNSFRFEYNDSYLPPHLCIHGLAASIHQNTQARLKDITTSCTHQIDGNIGLVQGLPVAHRISGNNQGLPVAHRISCNNRLCGGYHVKPSNSGNRWFRDSGGNSNESQDHNSGRGNNGHTHDLRVPHDHGQPRGARCFSQPDCNQRPLLKGAQCTVCKRVGYKAKQCNMLATAICLERYMKNDLSATLRDAIEKEWLDRWKERLGNPNHTPHQVMQTYVEVLDITVARHDEGMD
jgi:hypothetical protein